MSQAVTKYDVVPLGKDTLRVKRDGTAAFSTFALDGTETWQALVAAVDGQESTYIYAGCTRSRSFKRVEPAPDCSAPPSLFVAGKRRSLPVLFDLKGEATSLVFVQSRGVVYRFERKEQAGKTLIQARVGDELVLSPTAITDPSRFSAPTSQSWSRLAGQAADSLASVAAWVRTAEARVDWGAAGKVVGVLVAAAAAIAGVVAAIKAGIGIPLVLVAIAAAALLGPKAGVARPVAPPYLNLNACLTESSPSASVESASVETATLVSLGYAAAAAYMRGENVDVELLNRALPLIAALEVDRQVAELRPDYAELLTAGQLDRLATAAANALAERMKNPGAQYDPHTMAFPSLVRAAVQNALGALGVQAMLARMDGLTEEQQEVLKDLEKNAGASAEAARNGGLTAAAHAQNLVNRLVQAGFGRCEAVQLVVDNFQTWVAPWAMGDLADCDNRAQLSKARNELRSQNTHCGFKEHADKVPDGKPDCGDKLPRGKGFFFQPPPTSFQQ